MLSVAILFVFAAAGVQALDGEGVRARTFGHHDLAKRVEVAAAVEEDVVQNITARGNGRKQGLDWGQDDGPLKNFQVPGAPVYNWTPHPPLEAKKYGMNPVPMLWGKKNLGGDCEARKRCWWHIKKGGPYNTVMGFNEPNQPGQSDMSYQEAVHLWKKWIEPLAHGKNAMRTVSPATTSAPSGLVWMKNFVKHCTGCKIDLIALHWYSTSADGFIKYVKSFHAAFPDKHLWITEFACQSMVHKLKQCTQQEAHDFMRKVTDWMDKTPYVERYFAFGLSNNHMAGVNKVNQLMDKSGHPTAQGRIFLGRG